MIYHNKFLFSSLKGIYCRQCANEALPLPQFGVLTSQRMCKECIIKQQEAFALQARLEKQRQKLIDIEEQHDLLRDQYSNILLAGSNFVRVDSQGTSERRLILDEDLKTITEINLRTNTISSSMHVGDLDIRRGVDRKTLEEFKFHLSTHEQCFTLRTKNETLIYQSSNNEHNIWYEGIVLAKAVASMPKVQEAIAGKISAIAQELDAVIRSQMDFALKKIVADISSVRNKNTKPVIVDTKVISNTSQKRYDESIKRKIGRQQVVLSKDKNIKRIDEVEDIFN